MSTNEMVGTRLSLISSHLERVKIYEAQTVISQAHERHIAACTQFFQPEENASFDAVTTFNSVLTGVNVALYKLVQFQAELLQTSEYLDDLASLLAIDDSVKDNQSSLEQFQNRHHELFTQWHQVQREGRELKTRVRGSLNRAILKVDSKSPESSTFKMTRSR